MSKWFLNLIILFLFLGLSTACSVAVTEISSLGEKVDPNSTSTIHSTVTSSMPSVVANGTSQSVITVTLRDYKSVPLVGHTVSLTSDRGVLDSISAPSGVSDSFGIVTFTVTSTFAGVSNYSAFDTTNAISINQTVGVVFTSMTTSALLSTVIASPTSLLADGVQTSTVTVTILDGTTMPAAGKTVSLTSSRGASDTISVLSAITNSSGVATFNVSSTSPGSGVFTANVLADFVTVTQTATIDFTLAASASNSTLMAGSSIISANGIATSLMTVTLRDTANNPLPGKSVSLTSSRGVADTIAVLSAITNAAGIATFNVKSTNPGFAVFTATNTSESLAVTQKATVQYYQNLSLAPASYNMGINNFGLFTYSGGLGPYSFSLFSGPGTLSQSGVYTPGGTAGSAVIRVTDVGTGGFADANVNIFASGTYQSISSNYKYNCAITTSGQLKCWGENLSGRLGLGDNADRYSPQIVDAGTTYQSVSVGGFHACGITTAGELKCWGFNSNGQLGNGTTVSSNLPIVINAGTNYLKVSAGFYHTCAITFTNELRCWGQNNKGQLGDNTVVDKTIPTSISGGDLYSNVSAGGRHTCAITTSNDLRCWGWNDVGQLGDTTIIDKSVPILIGSNYNLISSGHKHTCAINTGGNLFCWGISFAGFYNGASGGATSPSAIEAGTTFSSVSAGNGYSPQSSEGINRTCAVTTSGILKCWGTAFSGEMGNGVLSVSPSNPITINSGTSYLTISVGARHSCGITAANKLRCWGENLQGELGLNWSSTFSSPIGIDAPLTYKSVAGSVSTDHACAITSTDNLRCWGLNSTGQLGNNSTVTAPLPVNVDGATTYKLISAGSNFTCGLTLTGDLKCWGYNGFGQVGDNTTINKTTPVIIDSGTSYLSLSSGLSHSCAITTANVLKCWGANSDMQLGNGTTTQSTSPIVIDSGVSYKQVSAGNGFTCGVTDSDQLKCWGKNTNGQLGNGSTTPSGTPIVIDPGTSYLKASSGLWHACGLTLAGSIKCWGLNSSGTLGDGTSTQRLSPTATTDVSTKYVDLIAGSYVTCGIVETGAAKCWGYNAYGQIGVGNTFSVINPTFIDPGVGYQSLSPHQTGRTFGVTTTGILKGWGDYSYLGNGLQPVFTPSFELP